MMLTDAEIRRRREASIVAMKARDAEEWQRTYQETCDRMYWARGKCCAGCDHWQSDAGLTGRCSASPIMSGADVLLSIGVTFSSYMPEPGHPFTQAEFHCGTFRDDFDWSTLTREYLTKIGAVKRGELREKPQTVAT